MAVPARTTAAPRKRTRFRPLVFALVTLVAVPVLLVLGAELVLRASGYGFDPHFFRTEEIDGERRARENPEFSRRFFPAAIARWQHPFNLSVAKGEAIRIVVMGASAAMGEPEPAFSVARHLEVQLQAAYPEHAIEVLNAAVTATNSHVLVSEASDLAELDPDLAVVYVGNNEVVGPFGPGTVFSGFQRSRGFIRLQAGMQRYRLGQWLAEVAAPPVEDVERWAGLEMFREQAVASGDGRLERVYAHYEANLRDVHAAFRARGIPVLLSTVAVNLKDQPPFISVHGEGFDDGGSAAFDELLVRAEASLAAGEAPAAEMAARAAVVQDGGYAMGHYLLGRALWALGRQAEAAEHFAWALEHDALRSRADAGLNAVVRELGEAGVPGLRVVDAAAALAALSPHGVLGEELFWEHVHFNFTGNYELARVFFAVVVEELVGAGRVPEARLEAPLSEVEVRAQLAYTTWEQQVMRKKIIDRLEAPPFAGLATLAGKVEELNEQHRAGAEILAKAENQPAVIELYEQALAWRPDDWVIHENLGGFYRVLQRNEEALESYRAAEARVPGAVRLLYSQGEMLMRLGRLEEARLILERVAQVPPVFAKVNFYLATIALREGDPQRAQELLEIEVEQHPDNAIAWTQLAEAYYQTGQSERARQAIAESLEVGDEGELWFAAAQVFARHGDLRRAEEHLAQALRRDPGNREYLVFRARLMAAQTPRPGP